MSCGHNINSRRQSLKTAIYVHGSSADQHVESQLYDLRELAAQRGLNVVQEYRDSGVSGKRARRPGLDALIADARQKKFSTVLVAAFDRVARSVKHFLQVMDEFDGLGIIFISRRENIDTSGPTSLRATTARLPSRASSSTAAIRRFLKTTL